MGGGWQRGGGRLGKRLGWAGAGAGPELSAEAPVHFSGCLAQMKSTHPSPCYLLEEEGEDGLGGCSPVHTALATRPLYSGGTSSCGADVRRNTRGRGCRTSPGSASPKRPKLPVLPCLVCCFPERGGFGVPNREVQEAEFGAFFHPTVLSHLCRRTSTSSSPPPLERVCFPFKASLSSPRAGPPLPAPQPASGTACPRRAPSAQPPLTVAVCSPPGQPGAQDRAL